MRALVMFLALGLAAPPAAAEPSKAPKKKSSVAKKKAQPKPTSPGVSLGSMAQAAAGSSTDKETTPTPNGARRLDLTPSRLFGKSDPPNRRGKEKTSGMSLGNDSSWQAQAVQVGAIAAGFAALVAICGNGNCLLPWGGGADNLGPPADLQIRPDNEPRPAR